jgi:hypothetical protein
MTAQGNLWTGGVTFDYSYPAFFNAGQHSYYFEASIAGSVNIIYPAAGTLQFNVVNAVPNMVELDGPPKNSFSIIQPLQLKWFSSAGAISYNLQLGVDSTFASELLNKSGLSDTTFSVSNLNSLTTYYWRVNAANSTGTSAWSQVWNFTTLLTTGITNNSSGLPVSYNLFQNYPNPFNPSTLIKFALPFSSDVKLEVYNILGVRIKELLNEQKPAGYYEINFNTAGLASGVYFYSIEANSLDGKSQFKSFKKMMLLK